MWTLLVIPVAAAAAYFYGKQKQENAAPVPLPKKDTAFPTVVPTVMPPGAAGTGTVDGHGTGLLLGTPVAGVPANPIDVAQAVQDAKVAQLQAQAAASAAKLAQAQNPEAATVAAAQAAEILKSEMITALNTPEGDRTPEQTALLLGLGSLPTLAPV
jgi:hypothetical protein